MNRRDYDLVAYALKQVMADVSADAETVKLVTNRLADIFGTDSRFQRALFMKAASGMEEE